MKRRLSDESQKKVAELLDLRCNRKLLQVQVKKNKQKEVTLKDLSNIKQKYQKTEKSNLQEAIDLIEQNGKFQMSVI